MIVPTLSLGKPDVLSCLLDVDYRIPGYSGSSAFAENELVKTLLVRGADPNVLDREAGETTRVLLDEEWGWIM